MDINDIWWSRIDTSINTIQSISYALSDRANVIFNIENNLPWRDTFYDAVSRALALVTSSKSIEFIDYASGDPGKVIFDRLCHASVKADYWPNISYAEFLGKRNDIILNNRVVWVKNIKSVTDINNWIKFITNYTKAASEENHDFGLFVLECRSDKSISFEKNCFKEIKYCDSKLDRYILCISKLSELTYNFSVKQYIADLACTIGRKDTELCGALSQLGERLAENPEAETFEVLKGLRSDNTHYNKIDIDRLRSYILTAQVKNIFPALEHMRVKFIEAHDSELYKKLPIVDSLSSTITEPKELEIGTLFCILYRNKNDFSESDFQTVEKCREYRNALAHNELISWGSVKYILSNEDD